MGGKLAQEPARLRRNGLGTVWPKECPRALLKLALERLRQQGDKMCERRTKGHVHMMR